MKRLFTLDEARALLPRLRELACALQERKAEFDRHREALELLATRASGDGGRLQEPLARHRAAVERLAAAIQEMIEEVHALGAEVKGLEQGLIDFPSERDGRVVYLCWMLDEPDTAWWHDLETGFRGRQPLEKD